MQALLTDLEEVTLGEMVAKKQFSSLTTTYKWIASKIQNSESDVLKELKELTNMGTQLCAQKITLEPWRSSRSENLACLMKGLKEKGLDTLCPDVVEHADSMECAMCCIKYYDNGLYFSLLTFYGIKYHRC